MATTTPPPPTPAQSDAKVLLDRLLDSYGLSSLKDWAWQQVVLNRSTDEIVSYLYERPEFKARFPAIEARQKAGLAPISAQDYITYEEAARQAMRGANLPAGFWDKPSDFTSLIANDVSVDELNNRITQGYQRVAQAPQVVRDAYRGYFGINGDAALAAQFLDPTQAQSVLADRVRQAEFGGTAVEHGWSISAPEAAQWSKRDLGIGEVQSGFSRLDDLRPLLDETMTETAEPDLTKQEGLEVAFGEHDASVFTRRLAARKAAEAGRGGAASSDTGAVGLGEAWP